MSIPFALSLGKYVSSTATDVGFASLLGVALLALLYFAGARETRTLRDQLEDAHSKLTSLEARLSQSLRNQAARAQASQPAPVPSVPGRPGVVPAPTVGAMGSAVARVQREAAGALAGAPGALIGAAMASAAPALGSATKLIPSPALVPAVLAEPAAVPAAATVAAGAYVEEDEEEYEEDFSPEDTVFAPAARTAAAANGRAGGGGGGAAVAAPPRVRLYDDEAQDSGPLPRRTIPTVATGPSRSRVFAGRLGGSLAAVVVVAVIVVVLLLITSSGGAKHTATTAGKTHTTAVRKKAPIFEPSKVTVSVLNGTSTSGLAGDVGAKLMSGGYKVPAASITNDGAQQQAPSTTVTYLPGYGNAAVHIAKTLARTYGIAQPQTVVASKLDITNCGTPVATGVTGACPANVIVIVGNDLAGIAASANTGG